MSSLSQASRLAYLPSAHDAFQGHAAHRIEWSICLGPRTQRVPVYPQVLPHSSRLLHGAAHTPTTMPHLTAWRASELSVRVSPASFHCPSHPLQALPCSSWRTQASWGRWHVPRGPVHSLWLPSISIGYTGLPMPPSAESLLCSASVFTPAKCGFKLDWLAYQGRYARGSFPVGLCVLQVIHHPISQPNATSWRLPFSAWHLLGACCSHHRVV